MPVTFFLSPTVYFLFIHSSFDFSFPPSFAFSFFQFSPFFQSYFYQTLFPLFFLHSLFLILNFIVQYSSFLPSLLPNFSSLPIYFLFFINRTFLLPSPYTISLLFLFSLCLSISFPLLHLLPKFLLSYLYVLRSFLVLPSSPFISSPFSSVFLSFCQSLSIFLCYSSVRSFVPGLSSFSLHFPVVSSPFSLFLSMFSFLHPPLFLHYYSLFCSFLVLPSLPSHFLSSPLH